MFQTKIVKQIMLDFYQKLLVSEMKGEVRNPDITWIATIELHLLEKKHFLIYFLFINIYMTFKFNFPIIP